MQASDRARYLRRLRFPDEIEDAFQQDYYQKFLPSLRKILLALVFLIASIVIREMITAYSFRTAPEQIITTAKGLIGNASSIPVLLIFRKLTYLKQFNKYFQSSSSLFLIFIFLFLCLTTSYAISMRDTLVLNQFQNASNNPALLFDIKNQLNRGRFYFFIRLIPIGMLFLAAFRLQFRWALSAMVAFVAIALWCVVKRLNIGFSPEYIGATIQVSCTSIVGAYFVALVQERLAREAFLANYLLDMERTKSERLLANVLPETVAHRLKDEPTTIADRFESATVLFADIVDFTQLAAKLSSEELVSLLNEIFSAFDALAEKHGLEKIKTIGDAYMAVAGVPEPDDNHAQAAARMALELHTIAAGFKRESGEPLQLRVGLHSGPVIAGVIGTKKFIYDLWGDTVNTASRMESHGIQGQIQVTEATKMLLDTEFVFSPSREIEVKGKGQMLVYSLLGSREN